MDPSHVYWPGSTLITLELLCQVWIDLARQIDLPGESVSLMQIVSNEVVSQCLLAEYEERKIYCYAYDSYLEVHTASKDKSSTSYEPLATVHSFTNAEDGAILVRNILSAWLKLKD